MTSLTRTLGAALLTVPLALPAIAQDTPAEETEGMTCAAFLEQDDVQRVETMQVFAEAIGMEEAVAEEQATSGQFADMIAFCEADPQMAAFDAFQNAIDPA